MIRGWLVELRERGLREQALEELSGYVEDTGEVKWAVCAGESSLDSRDRSVGIGALSLSRSRGCGGYWRRALAPFLEGHLFHKKAERG